MMTKSKSIEQIVGPRAPKEAVEEDPLRYLLPTLFLGLAAFCLLISIFQPYWQMTLLAPQYPAGLTVEVYVNRMEGDVFEIDVLNHYIGMRPLGEAAQLERSLSILAISVLSLLVLAAIVVHTRWAAFLSLPAALFPFIFLADMYFWMHNFGQNLDPTAPLNVEPFVPPIIGEGIVGQFRTLAELGSGFYLAVFASLLILVGLYFHRRAYKPLVDEQEQKTARGGA